MNAFVGLGGGLTGLASGYWIDADGYLAPTLFSIGACAFGAILLPFLPSASKILKEKNEAIKRDLDIRTFKENHSKPEPDYGSNVNHTDSRYETVKHDVGDELGQAPSLLVDPNDKKEQTLSDICKSMWRLFSTEYSACKECFGVKPDLSEMMMFFSL